MAAVDWIIVGLYVAFALVLGLVFARKASGDTAGFFAAGRSLPWWIAGTSLVATSFSSDTPLFVAGLSRNEGIQGNWFWWSFAIGQTATIFFFARLWRRTGVLTEVEFISIRYDDSAARSGLRIFKVLFDGVVFNTIVMASVTLAASKVFEVILGLDRTPIFELALWGDAADPVIRLTRTDAVLVVLGLCALVYSAASGLYGVVYTDLIQFVLAMIGSIWLAVVSFRAAAPDGNLAAGLAEAPGFSEAMTRLLPDLSSMNLLTFTFLIYVSISWWKIAPGNGYAVQRLLATRSERDSMLTFLWYCFCHYVLRPWPWILVGLVSMIYFPDLDGPSAEQAYPEMINRFLGPGIKGVMVAAMLAAYMSTIDTHLNWGASYLVNDLYQPFIRPGAGARECVRVSRACMAALMGLTLVLTPFLTGILAAYKYLGVIYGAMGTVLILRWYWWRVSAWSEIAAIAAALGVGNATEIWLANPVRDGVVVADYFAYRVMITTFATAAVWIAVTLAASRAPSAQAVAFFRRIRVAGPGWRRVSRETGVEAQAGEFGINLLGWIASTVFIFGMLLGIGHLVFARWTAAAAALAVAAAAGAVTGRVMARQLRDV